MRSPAIQLLLSMSFLLVFTIKQVVPVLPALLGKVGLELAVAVEAEEQASEEKTEKEKAEKDKKGYEEKYDIALRNPFFLQVVHNRFAAYSLPAVAIYHPTVPTPPPDRA